MRHNDHTPDTGPVDTSHGYELRDISLPVIIRWVIILFIFMAISAGIAAASYFVFLPRNTTLATDTPMRPAQMLPPEPRLQALPKAEMRDFREDETAKTEHAAWLDKAKGVARIPIADAMKLTAARLQTQPTSAGDPAYAATESGRHWPAPQPVGTDAGYKQPVVTRKYPY